MLEVNNRNTRTIYEMRSKLTINTPKRFGYFCTKTIIFSLIRGSIILIFMFLNPKVLFIRFIGRLFMSFPPFLRP